MCQTNETAIAVRRTSNVTNRRERVFAELPELLVAGKRPVAGNEVVMAVARQRHQEEMEGVERGADKTTMLVFPLFLRRRPKHAISS